MGLNLALTARRRHPTATIIVMEKEKGLAAHASGRNSGVLHAGFYYTPNSLRARFTRDGNRLLTEYCRHRNLRLNRCGKLVVAKSEAELDTLKVLVQRGAANGIELHELTTKEAQAIEPRVKTFGKALFSPTTATVDPVEVMNALAQEAASLKIEIMFDTCYLSRQGQTVTTSRGTLFAGYIVNAAGLYADRVARDYGFSSDYRILPIKGLYLCSDEPPGALNTHIYPVPDLNHPFLGVHFTLTSNGRIKVGPTAIPALWRESYGGLKNFKFRELAEIVSCELGLLVRDDFGFRRLALSELSKYSRSRLISLASEMLHGVSRNSYRRWGLPGIRAQLVNIKMRKLEMDFRYEGDSHSFHVLNAVSPAFTCSMPFCEYLFDRIEKMTG